MKDLIENLWIITKEIFTSWFPAIHNADIGRLGDLKNGITAIPILIAIIIIFWRWITRND